MQLSTWHFKEFFSPLNTLDNIFEIICVTRYNILLELLNQPFLSLLQFKHFDQSQCGNRVLIVKFPSTFGHYEHELLGEINKDLFFDIILVKHTFEQALIDQG